MTIYQWCIVIGGLIGVVLAWWRCSTADQNLKQEKFRIGATLLEGHGKDYLKRVAGAIVLSDLALQDPKKYDSLVMQIFETFLCNPATFPDGAGEGRAGRVDFASRDTVRIVKAIRDRKKESRDAYQISLPNWAPFETDPCGNVRARRGHVDYIHWVANEGHEPRYDADD